MEFPYIKPIGKDGTTEAIAALKLVSLVKSDLLIDSYYNSADESHTSSRILPPQLQYFREALLAAIADWSSSFTLELHIAATPNLAQKTRSTIDIHLLLRTFAADEDAAKEQILSRYLLLMPLLAAHQPEAIWQPACDEAELQKCISSFTATHAVSIHRKQEQIYLGKELPNATLGFLAPPAAPEADEEPVSHLCAWQPSHDDWSRLLETLVGQLDPLRIVIRLAPGTDTEAEKKNLTELIQRCESILSGMELADNMALKSQIQILRDNCLYRLAECREDCFQVGVFLLAPHPIDSSLANMLGWAVAGAKNPKDKFGFFRGSWAFAPVSAEKASSYHYIHDTRPFSLMEAACAFRLPAPPSRDIPGLQVRRFRTSLAPLPAAVDQGKDTIRLFYNEHQGQLQPVCISSKDRFRHMFIAGQTGTGKSTLMETMIVQDILAGRGLAVIDPHGDMIDNVLLKIPKERADDVVILDLLDRDRPIGFNIIQWSTIEERDLIIDEIYCILNHLYDLKTTGGPIFEQYFRGMMRLLMGDRQRDGFIPTILEFIRCFNDAEFRNWLAEGIHDHQVLEFLAMSKAAGGEASLSNITPYITSKFGRFVNDTTLRRILGQEESTINFESIMNEGKILLVKLGKGRFGSEISALLANMIVVRFKLAGMKRGEMPREQRRDFFLYVDEAHNLPPENFTELLSEARKYRIGLVLATQYCGQLGAVRGGGDDLLAAVFGNVGTTVVFRTGATDAEVLAKTMVPYFSQLDILGLPNYHGYARMNLNMEAAIPFSFTTAMDENPHYPEIAPKIRIISRLKYGQDANIVEAKIFARSTSIGKKKERPNDTVPNVVNFVAFEQSFMALGAPVRIDSLLKNAGLMTLRDIVLCSKTELVESKGFTLEGVETLEFCLDQLGLCLQDWTPFRKLSVEDFDMDSFNFDVP